MDNQVTRSARCAHDDPVSAHLGTTDAPPAIRATRPTWRDPRLWVGVVLLAGSVLLGVRVVATADDSVEVWAAAGDLGQGQEVAVDDLVVRRVRFADGEAAQGYWPASQPLPTDAVLLRSVGRGELLPRAALGGAREGLVEVPIRVPTASVPSSVRAGSVVDVWVLAATDGPGSRARLVLDDVLVIAAPRADQGFGPGGTRQVLVGVPDGHAQVVGDVLAAARDDRVAVTRQG